MKLINLLIIALSAASTSADENKAAATATNLLRGTVNSEKDIMSTLSCAHGTGSRGFTDQCGNNKQCASCCCSSYNGGGPKTCKPTGWCNSILDEDTDGDVVAAVEEEEEEDVEEEEEDFAALSCVAPNHSCNPNAAFKSAAACCSGNGLGPHWCNCVWNSSSDGSDAGTQEGHKVCTCEGDADEEEFPFVAAASS